MTEAAPHHTHPLPLRLAGVGKEYKLYDSPRARLKSLLTGRALHRSHWALQGVSLELARGQCLGVVGSNGAGKSTLLKLITGTLQPSCGQLARSGRVTAILELGAGFHPEFTGRQNLYFGGSLIGIPAEQMRALEPEVLAFAEIGEAIDRPVKTYSSGMTVRLAFALVTAVEPDLLIIDEALAVGDQHFQKKCVERIEQFRRNGCTILFCSHSPYHIRHLCDVALWLDAGRVMEFGPTEAVLGAYEKHSRLLDAAGSAAPAAVSAAPSPAAPPLPYERGPGSAMILSCELAGLTEPDADNAPGAPRVLQARDLVATIVVRGQGEERPNIGFMIEQDRGVGITSLATHEEGAAPTPLGDRTWRSVLTFPDLPLHTGDYVISVFLFDESGLVTYDLWFKFMTFRFVSPTLMPGLVRLPHTWS
ncbi:MAG: ABC transporter ATP-binding protein [Ottowia sp.]|nr:ABC transporter ATP-binding protein [Achromobacter sp.]MBP7530968.1 ABC transporter ATP-binding protein [Ottowia sp.]MBP9954152.1 ABC transporter ATP-binding protein [Ottowia sp.]